MKKFLYLDKESVPVTGGQKFDADFLYVLENDIESQVTYTPSVHEAYKRIPKVFIPFAELKWLGLVQKNDFVFFGDTSYKYHFLLLLLTRLFTRTKCLAIVHHYSFLGMKGLRRSFKAFCEKQYDGLMHEIIYPNPYIYDLGKTFFPTKKLSYIPTHIHRKLNRDVTPMSNQLLYVGTVEQRKGIHLLVKSLKIVVEQYPNIKLNIVGKIAYYSYYNNLVSNINNAGLEDNVHFAGRVSDELLDSYFKQAYIFTFPSLLEGYGLSIVEAMQYGIPVVAYNNSAMPYTIKDGINGFLAENENYEEFAQKLIDILKNPALRDKMQDGAYNTINRITDYDEFRQILIEHIKNLK